MIEGHACLMQRFPLTLFSSISFPFSSIKQGTIPGIGKVANDGIAGVIPAKFEIKMPPVSVCHQVSTIGHLFFPMFVLYQCQASSFIGSPTDPNTFKEDKSFPFKGSKP